MLGLVYAGVSGILLTLGFAPYSQAWVGWVALVPLAFYIVWQKVLWGEAARLGSFCGLIHFLCSLFWLTNVSWLGWSLLGLYLAVYPMVWAILWQQLTLSKPKEFTSGYNLRVAVLGASAWVALEWVRGWMFTGFPWNMLGVTQCSIVPVIQIADLGGVFLVSWLAAFVNCVFAMHLRRFLLEIKGKQALRPRVDLIVVILLLVGTFMYGVYRLKHLISSQTQLQYLVIQPNIPQDPWRQAPSSETLQKLRDLTLEGLSGLEGENLPDLIIWPETPISVSVFESEEFYNIVKEIVSKTSRPLLLGSNDYVPPKVYNSAVLFGDGEAQVYHKRHLVLMGEYVPFTKIMPFLRKLVPPGMDFSPGNGADKLDLQKPDVGMSPFVCFEDVVPRLALDSMRKNPDFFVNLTNDGWFRESCASQQHINNALFRTVEFRRPMIRVTNNGITAVISENGILQKIFSDAKGNVHGAGFMRGMLMIPKNTVTLYQRLGLWVPKLCLIVVLVGLILFKRKEDRAGDV